MKALYLTAIGQTELMEIPMPVNGDEDVLLRISHVGFAEATSMDSKVCLNYRNTPISLDTKWVAPL